MHPSLSTSLTSKSRFRTILPVALLLVSLCPVRGHALQGRLGAHLAEGPGIWLQVRHPIAGTDFGIHLAGSFIDLDVMSRGATIYGTDERGIPTYTPGPLAPSTVTALFYEWGIVVGREIYTRDSWNLEVNTGFQGGLLDGTLDESMRPLATEMLLVPLHLDGTWYPFTGAARRFGFQLGAGGVWTFPGDEDNLYPEVSAWRWQVRSGLLF